MIQTISPTKRVKVLAFVSRPHAFMWISAGEYKVRRDFDDTRYLIETAEGLTLVNKLLTRAV